MKFKIALNTFFQLLGKGVTTLSTLITTILIAKSFGPEGFGNFTLITTFVAVFYLVADFGLNAIVIEKFKEDKYKYFKNLLGLRILLSLVLIFICVSLLSLFPQNETFNLVVRFGIIAYSLSIISQGLITTANIIFQNNLRYDLSTISLLLGSVINLILVFFFTSQNLPLIFIILSLLIGNTVSALSSLFLAKQTDKEVSLVPSFDKKVFKNLFTSSFPLGITLIFNLIYFRADTFILALSKTSVDVGNYGLAYRFFEVVLVFPSFFMNSLYPALLSRKENIEVLKKTIEKAFVVLLISSVVITCVFEIFSPNLIMISGGNLYNQSTLALRLLSLSFPAFFLSSLYMWVLITLGKRKILSIVYGTSMILNIILNIIFIPAFGIFAAAIITGLCETLILILTFILSKKYLRKQL